MHQILLSRYSREELQQRTWEEGSVPGWSCSVTQLSVTMGTDTGEAGLLVFMEFLSKWMALLKALSKGTIGHCKPSCSWPCRVCLISDWIGLEDWFSGHRVGVNTYFKCKREPRRPFISPSLIDIPVSWLSVTCCVMSESRTLNYT